MNLFRNRNKMESHLRKQLSDQEFKPSDTLWERIEQDLSGDFEAKIRKKLEGMEVTPAPESWDYVEESLPAERTNGYVYRNVFIGLTVLLFTAFSFYFMYEQTPGSQPELTQTVAPEVKSDNVVQPSTAHETAGHEVKTKVTRSPHLLSQAVRTHLQPGTTTPALLSNNGQVNASRNSASGNNTAPAASSSVASEQPDQPLPSTNTPVAVNSSVGAENSNPPVAAPPAMPVVLETPPANMPEVAKETPTATTTGEIPVPAGNDSTGQIGRVKTTIDVAVTQQGNKTGTFDPESPTRFSLTTLAELNSCMMQLSEPSTAKYDFSKNKALREALEAPGLDWSGSFLLDFQITKRLTISSGVGLLNFTQRFYYNTQTPTVAPNTPERGARVINANDSIVMGDAYSTRIRYSWTEIPLLITYRFTNFGRFNLSLRGGISYAILSTSDAGMVNYDNVGVLVIKDKSAFPGLQNNFFLSLSPVLTYNLNENIKLGLMPTARVSMNSMIARTNWLQQYPYLLGMGLSISRQF